MELTENIDVDKIPEEKPDHHINTLNYLCPKCEASVWGIYGLKDSTGKAWSVNQCEKCGYIYKCAVD